MIEFNHVSKVYENGTKALNDVNLKIEKGEFVFVVGASGAGKSTFLKLIMREEIPSSGEVIVNDYRASSLKRREIPYYRRTMGIVFQDFRLIPKMSVYDNVAFAMRVIGKREKEIRKRVPYILGLVGLAAKARSYPTELSGGEQQRVALARALVNNPKMIIADEPTGNVDPEMSFEIVELLNSINATGTTVLMVTHEHDLVRQFDRRVIVIKNGTVVADGDNSRNFEFETEKGVDSDMFYYAPDTDITRQSVPNPVEEEAADDEDDNNAMDVYEEIIDEAELVYGVGEAPRSDAEPAGLQEGGDAQ